MRLRLSDGDVEGVVASVCDKTFRLSLVDAIDLETREELSTVVHCLAKDIKSCVILENTKRKKYILSKEQDGPLLLRVRPVRPCPPDASGDGSEFICHRMEGDTTEPIMKGSIKLIGSPDDLPKLKKPIATEFEVVNEVNDQLIEAVAAIKSEESISVGCEGKDVGRHGFLSVLVIATTTKVYIFDVCALEEKLFSHGLKEILESKDIEKVIHGCRHLSDCLFHKYQVSLDNVFDTMVADVIIQHNISVDAGRYEFPNLVQGIQNCLRSFLKFDCMQLKYIRSRQAIQEQVLIWKQRPLSLRQIDALAKDVVFLRELAHACLREMLIKFHSGVKFFVTLDRSCTEKELSYLPERHCLPRGFADAVKWATGHSEQQRRRYTGEDGRKGNNRFCEHDNASRGPYRMNADRTHFREPRGTSHRGEFSEKRARQEDSLLYIGEHQRAKKNSVKRFSAAPGPDGTCNGSERQWNSPEKKKEGKKPSDVPVSEPVLNGHKHPSDSEPLVQQCTEVAVEAVNGKHDQVLNGNQYNIADIRYGPLLSRCLQRPQPSSVPEENAAVFGEEDNSGATETTVGIKKEVPRCHRSWADRPIDSTMKMTIRPAELTVAKVIEHAQAKDILQRLSY